ncbi:MAG: hypothetical protein RL196_696 [Actinomycetota bacterium]|jgi:hypothetical protein
MILKVKTRVAAGTVFYRTEDILVSAIWNLVSQGILDFYLIRHDEPGTEIETLLDEFRGHARIRLVSKTTAPFVQGRMMTFLAQAARADGFDVFVPFDSDEFLQNATDAPPLLEQLGVLARSKDVAWLLTCKDLVQESTVDIFSEPHLLSAKFACQKRIGFAPSDSAEISHLGQRFAEPAGQKVIINLNCLPSDNDFHIYEGQHSLYVRSKSTQGRPIETLAIAHLPYRSRQNLFDRKNQARRRSAAGFGANVGTHQRVHLLASPETLNAQWRELSWVQNESGFSFATPNDAIELVADESLARVAARISEFGKQALCVEETQSWNESSSNQRFAQQIIDMAIDSENGFAGRNSLILQIRQLSFERDQLVKALLKHAPDAAEAHMRRTSSLNRLVRFASKLISNA